MRIDRSHTPWILFVLAATAGSTLLFLANFYPQDLPFAFRLPAFFGQSPPARQTFGGTPLGLIFGSIAYLIFLFASALGIRKKKRHWPIGHVQFWLKAHIWLTILTLPLVVFHCGFKSGGIFTSWLMVLYAFVMGSGFFGLALQQFMPQLMKSQLPREVLFEQIPHVRANLFEAALELRHEVRHAVKGQEEKPLAAVPAGRGTAAVVVLSESEDPSLKVLGEFLDDECLPYLRSDRGTRSKLGDQRNAKNIFRLLKLSVTEKWEPKVSDMESWCDDRRLMDLQLKLHHWLHGWLVIHIPTSFALIIYTAWHAWIAVRYLIILT